MFLTQEQYATTEKQVYSDQQSGGLSSCAVSVELASTEFEAVIMAIVSSIKGILSLIDSLGISTSYPSQGWVNQELVPALKTVADRIGAVENSLHANGARDLTLWIIMGAFGIPSIVSAFLIYKWMTHARSKIASVSRGIVKIGTKLNLCDNQPMPEMKV